jgi:DNA gyrase subunit A
MKKYDLDADQTDAILELKIYRLARLEILVIRKELEDKRRRVRPAARQRGVIKLMAGEAEPLCFSA